MPVNLRSFAAQRQSRRSGPSIPTTLVRSVRNSKLEFGAPSQDEQKERERMDRDFYVLDD